MFNNSSIISPPTSPDTPATASSDSPLEEILISFAALIVLFITLCSYRCFFQQRAVRRASLLQKQPNNGLTQASIYSLPSFPYNRSENNGSTMECSICLCGVDEGEIVRVMPKCKHSFHKTCVELWLQGHTTCPVCRMEVLGEDRSTIIDPPRPFEMV